MIYGTAEGLIEGELPRNVRSQLYPIFTRGIKAYSGILNMPGGTFQSVFIHNIRGWLLNYMIFRQFEADMVSTSFPLVPEPVKVNNFKYTALNLIRGNIRLNVGRALDTNSFPNSSRYRQKNCGRNRFPTDDLFAGSSPVYDQFFEDEEPYYAFLTFNVKKGEIDFLNIMVPNWNMKMCLAQVNLKNELALYQAEPIAKTQDEKIIATLKNDFVKKILQKGDTDA